MTLPPVRHTRYDDSDSVYELCRTLSAEKDPCEGDTDEIRAARFTKRVQDGESKALLTAQRGNKKWCHHAPKINMVEFSRLHAQGMSVAEMAIALNVSERSVKRAIKSVRRDG